MQIEGKKFTKRALISKIVNFETSIIVKIYLILMLNSSHETLKNTVGKNMVGTSSRELKALVIFDEYKIQNAIVAFILAGHG